jgi:transcriptional regulator with XRE-family HTH domain
VISIKKVFGANVKYYRKERHFSQEQLAERLKITSKHLSTIETGATFVSAKLLEEITKNLSVSASALFYSVDDISIDDSLYSVIDQIIDEHYSKANEETKKRIRQILRVAQTENQVLKKH